MIMILDNAYKKQLGRYEFAIKYCSGKTLDYSFASIMSYHGSKILLDNGTEEIFSYDISNNKEELSHRKLDLNKKIVYSNYLIKRLLSAVFVLFSILTNNFSKMSILTK